MDANCRQKQSIQQTGALFLLILAAVFLSIGEGSNKASTSSNPDQILFFGIVPVLVASVLSGLASALCQWASQVITTLWLSEYALIYFNLVHVPILSHTLLSFHCRLKNIHHT